MENKNEAESRHKPKLTELDLVCIEAANKLHKLGYIEECANDREEVWRIIQKCFEKNKCETRGENEELDTFLILRLPLGKRSRLEIEEMELSDNWMEYLQQSEHTILECIIDGVDTKPIKNQ